MIRTIAKILFVIAVLWSLAFVFKLGNSFAMTNDQNTMYQGCVENAKQLGEQRAKQYCRCITLMITDKYSTEEIERIGLMSQETQLEKFSFATNYCNLNTNAPGD